MNQESAPEKEEVIANQVEKLDDVKISNVQVDIPEQTKVVNVAVPLTIGQKLYIEKCFNTAKTEIASAINGTQEQMRTKINTALTNLEQNQRMYLAREVGLQKKKMAELERKFGGMYKTLIHEFLVRLESRVLNTELYTKALVDACAEDFSRDAETWHKSFKERIESVAKAYSEKSSKTQLAPQPSDPAPQQPEEAKENVAAHQETPTQTSS